MSANPIDLITLQEAIDWLASNGQTISDPEAGNLQLAITAGSMEVLNRTSRGSSNGTVSAKSPFVEPVDYDESYDGNGNGRLFVRNWPIVSVAALTINGVAVRVSASPLATGYVVDGSGKSVSLRGINSSLFYRGSCAQCFALGVQNVHVQYKAGFDGTPFDLKLAALQMICENYKRRQSMGQSQQAMAQGAGTISFRSWDVAPQVQKVLDFYSRNSWAA